MRHQRVNPVVGGTIFKSDATYLVVTGGEFHDGCYGSSGRVEVKSSTLPVDESTPGGNDDGIGATDQVTYWHAGGASVTMTCNLLTGPAHGGSSSLDGEGTAAPGQLLRFAATIVDRFGNPLGDHTLVMTASGGSVAGGTQETNSYGEASGFQWTAPGAAGDYTITVQDTDPRGGIFLSKTVTVE